jgi:hypothetical protein
MLDPAVIDDESESLDKAQAADLEGRQMECGRKRKRFVAQHLKG